MWLVDLLAEPHISKAHAMRGEFDDRSGQGEPLVLEDKALVPGGPAHRLSPVEKCRLTAVGSQPAPGNRLARGSERPGVKRGTTTVTGPVTQRPVLPLSRFRPISLFGEQVHLAK